jgi:hypothetical protein
MNTTSGEAPTLGKEKKLAMFYRTFYRCNLVFAAANPVNFFIARSWYKPGSRCTSVVKLDIINKNKLKDPSGLYYKTITIVTLTIVSDATIWSITYDRN